MSYNTPSENREVLVDWNVHPSLPEINAQENKFTDLEDVIERAYQLNMLYMRLTRRIVSDITYIYTGDMCVFDFSATL